MPVQANTALDLVMTEVVATLQLAERALLSKQEQNQADYLQRCGYYLHQIYGALRLAQSFGAALLVHECEAVVRDWRRGRIVLAEQAFAVVNAAVQRLPVYLEWLQNGNPDRPLLLQTLINDCRFIRGVAPIAREALFTPNFAQVMHLGPPESIEIGDVEEVTQRLQALHKAYDNALFNLLHNHNVAEQLTQLHAISYQLTQLATHQDALRRLWSLASALVEVLLHQEAPIDRINKQALIQLGQDLKRWSLAPLVLADEKALQQLAEFCLDCLTATGFTEMAAQNEQISTTLVAQGSGHKSIDTVVLLLKEELQLVQAALETYASEVTVTGTPLTTCSERLQRIASTLKLLGLAAAYEVITAQIEQLHELMKTKANEQPLRLQNLAKRLLYAESLIEQTKYPCGQQLILLAKKSYHNAQLEEDEKVIGVAHLRGALDTVFRQARREIAAILRLLRDRSTAEALPDLTEAKARIVDLAKTLGLLQFARAEKVLKDCLQVLEVIMTAQLTPTYDDLKPLVEALQRVDHFLQCKLQDRPILDNALMES